MIHYSLNGRWLMAGSRDGTPEQGTGSPGTGGTCLRETEGKRTQDGRHAWTEGTIPGSVYSFLLDAGRMDDPYYRDNELDALKRMDQDYIFFRTFIPADGILSCAHQVLRFDGIDTLSEVCLNGQVLGRTDNMHISWEFDVCGILRPGENELSVTIFSPTRFIREADERYHLGGSDECMRGFPHLRKAHCMFGWDWGPRLPDGGIWRDVTLLGWNQSRIEEVKIRQRHLIKEDARAAAGDPEHACAAREGRICVDLTVEVVQSGDLPVEITLAGPDKTEAVLKNGKPFRIEDPKLWWPNGLGGQALYEVKASLMEPDRCVEPDCAALKETAGNGTDAREDARADSRADARNEARAAETVTRRIGLRTLTMRRDQDEWGESFAMEVNGQCVFSMGADYIPEDNILSRMNRERTARLLEMCVQAHFNVIRVWGGGFYPADWFFDLCDEMGLVVWQDMMFACANYRLTDEFAALIRTEITQNVRRIRHHPSLGIWCGNNEMEQFALERAYDGNDLTASDYLIQNEFIIPGIVKKEDPDAFYWPSSPSSGGHFDMPQDPNRGDVHFWAVWHAGVPFTEYRKYHFRYMSEFGFQSFPCMETVRSFTEEGDRNIFSYVMEMHQRNSGANGKILQYLSATYLYPGNFETLLYASQLLQADAIRYGVEHLRRNRDNQRCMGAVYWQLNDIWPVASWASVDYFQRWKALHYAAERFFAPVLLSCEEDSMVSRGETCITQPCAGENGTYAQISRARLNVSNETWDPVKGEVVWELRLPDSTVIESGTFPVNVPPFSTQWYKELDFSAYDPRQVHLTYRLSGNAGFSGIGSVLFTAPKHYRFADPKLSVSAGPSPDEVTVSAQAYTRYVEIYSENGYIRTDAHFFDLEAGDRTVKILEGKPDHLRVRSVFDIR